MALTLLKIGRQYGFERYELAARRQLESILSYRQLKNGDLDHSMQAVRGYEFRILDVVKGLVLHVIYPGAFYICCIVILVSIKCYSFFDIVLFTTSRLLGVPL